MSGPACQLLLLFLLFSLFAPTSPGMETAGTDRPGAESPAPGQQAKVQTSPDAAQLATITRHQAQIAELQAAAGPHAPGLIEIQQNLGLLQQQAGNHRNALVSLQAALQTIRVNEGLYSINQAPILEAIIDSNVALGARDELRRNYEYLFWLYRRNYGERDAGLVPVIKRVGQWYFDLYNLSPPNTTVEPLVAADDLYAKALKILPEGSPVQDRADMLQDRADESQDRAHNMRDGTASAQQDRADILYKVAVINHHIAEDVLDPMTSHREIREAMIPHGRSTPYLNEIAVRQYYADQSFYKGKRSLQRIVDGYGETLPAGIADYARALVFMGDWLTVQRRVLEGARKYREALTALAEYDAPALAEELFGEPQPIEQLPIPGEEEVTVGADSYYADALLDIPASGWPTNIRIQAIHPPEETTLVRRAERGIAATRYRPRYRDGQPVATTDVPLRFVFKYKEQPGWLHF